MVTCCLVGWLVGFCTCHVKYVHKIFLKKASKTVRALVPTKPESLCPLDSAALCLMMYWPLQILSPAPDTSPACPSPQEAKLDKPLQGSFDPWLLLDLASGEPALPSPRRLERKTKVSEGRCSPGSSVNSPPVGWVP